MSYEEGDTVTQTETDATSHSSGDAVETLRRRRLGVEHSFATSPLVVGVEIHRDGVGDGASGNASASPTPEPPASRRQQLYEVIPTRLVAPIINRNSVIIILVIIIILFLKYEFINQLIADSCDALIRSDVSSNADSLGNSS